MSDWGVYVSICLEISGIFGIFVLILFYFPSVELDFQESRVVLYVVLVDQKCFVLYHNGFKIVLFVTLVDSDAPSSASMYFWEVNKIKKKNLIVFFVYFTLCQTSENILLNIFMYTAKHCKMKIFSYKYFTLKKTERNKCFLRKKKEKKEVFIAFYLEHSI